MAGKEKDKEPESLLISIAADIAIIKQRSDEQHEWMKSVRDYINPKNLEQWASKIQKADEHLTKKQAVHGLVSYGTLIVVFFKEIKQMIIDFFLSQKK